jgi:predicted RNase H-like HicB family nuclease
MVLKIVFRPADDGGALADSPDVPGISCHGKTPAEALEKITSALSAHYRQKVAAAEIELGEEEDEDEKEQRQTWEFLQRALDEDRRSSRKLFP